MRIALTAATLLLCGCVHAQTGVNLPPPVKVLYNGVEGSISVNGPGNIEPLTIKRYAGHSEISTGFANTSLALLGSLGTDGRILLQPGPVTGLNAVVVTAPSAGLTGPELILEDLDGSHGVSFKRNGTQYLKIDTSSFATAATFTVADHIEFKGGATETQDIFPLTAVSYDIGAPLARFKDYYGKTASFNTGLTLDFLAGGGARCATVSNAGVVGAAACGGGVSSVSGTSPIVSSGGATPALSCATCFTTNTGQTATATKNFFPSSGSITTSFATITLSDKTTPVAGTGWNLQATLDASNDFLILSDSTAAQWLSVFKKVGGVSLTRGVFAGDWIPQTASVYDLGLVSDPWHALFLSGAGITVGGLPGITGGTCSHWTGGICTAP